MDTENHNDSSNQRDIRNNTVEAMDTEEGKITGRFLILRTKGAKMPINVDLFDFAAGACYDFLCVRTGIVIVSDIIRKPEMQAIPHSVG